MAVAVTRRADLHQEINVQDPACFLALQSRGILNHFFLEQPGIIIPVDFYRAFGAGGNAFGAPDTGPF